MQKYEYVKELGSGSYGKVILVRNKRDGEQLALKSIELSKLPSESRDKALQEVQLLRSLDHPNIVRLKDSFQEKGILHILMEYVDGGDLAQMIKQRNSKPFSEEEIMNIFIQIILALQYIHEKKIVHRDIKPQNIFLTRVGVAKIGDFGVARTLESTQDLCQTIIGTPYYLSPEVWSNEPYNSQTDIWSLGCILEWGDISGDARLDRIATPRNTNASSAVSIHHRRDMEGGSMGKTGPWNSPFRCDTRHPNYDRLRFGEMQYGSSIRMSDLITVRDNFQ
jgi:NIMA (never in mitosis gene a)-related kinase